MIRILFPPSKSTPSC